MKHGWAVAATTACSRCGAAWWKLLSIARDARHDGLVVELCDDLPVEKLVAHTGANGGDENHKDVPFIVVVENEDVRDVTESSDAITNAPRSLRSS